MFGRSIEGAVAHWGARAIYKGYQDGYLIDLLPDRQQMTGGTEDQRKQLCDWIDLRGLPMLREKLREHLMKR